MFMISGILQPNTCMIANCKTQAWFFEKLFLKGYHVKAGSEKERDKER